jgi:nitrite reductase/ring-hydroxylating ferredoxin subunit
MLTREDNELVTQVGPASPMGRLMREYWLPFLLSEELPTPDSDPLRIRLMGEDLVAFRGTDGRFGLVGNNCPHRGASLFFGRNEESGIRCVYHGWKFDVNGACVDMPNEPPESNFKHKVRVAAYPCRERNGIVWTYMGPSSPPPPLPELEWNMVPANHAYVSKRVADANWLQSLEGALDTAHSNFLHASVKKPGQGGTSVFGGPIAGAQRGMQLSAEDSHPRFETLSVDAGVLIAACRQTNEGCYWRVNNFIMPFYTQFPPRGANPPSSGHAWVPIDDQHTLVLHYNYHPTRPLSDEELHFYQHGKGGVEAFHPRVDGYLPATSEAYGAWRPIIRKANNYLLDYEYQRTEAFCGIRAGWAQDSAVQEGMGAIQDRTQEHLVSSDVGIIGMRRFLLESVKTYRDGTATAPGTADPGSFALRPASFLLGKDDEIWPVAMSEIRARPGEPLTVV